MVLLIIKEQNIRLIQQLREKDDVNFKLISERIKFENVQKILKEEKDAYSAQVCLFAILIKHILAFDGIIMHNLSFFKRFSSIIVHKYEKKKMQNQGFKILENSYLSVYMHNLSFFKDF